jgi:type I restriction enzyme S subunit
MEPWIEKTLGEVTSYMAKGIPPKYVEEDGPDVIRVLNQKCNRNFRISFDESRFHNNGIKRVPEDKMLKANDVLINSTGTGTAGRVAQIWDVLYPTTIDGHMIVLRPSAEIDPLYFGYAVKAYQSQIEGLAEGSTGQTEINRRRMLDEIIIRYPVSLDSQRAIGLMLQNLDEKILTNEAINENLAA